MTIEELQQAYKQEFGTDLPITSGRRSSAKQAELYANRDKNPYPVAKPGTSTHESGTAIDLEADKKTAEWLASKGWHQPYSNDPVHWEPKQMKNTTIELEDGRTIELEGQPTQEQINAVLKSLAGESSGGPKPVEPTTTEKIKTDLGERAMSAAKAAGEYTVANPETVIGGAGAYAANKLMGNPVGKLASGGATMAKNVGEGLTMAQKNPQMTAFRQGMSTMAPPGVDLKSLPSAQKAAYQVGQMPGAKALGRGLAGLGMGLSGLDAIDDYEAGNYGQASMNALGALGSGLALAPHPVAKAIGIPLGMLGPAAAAYLKSLDEKEKEAKKKSAK